MLRSASPRTRAPVAAALLGLALALPAAAADPPKPTVGVVGVHQGSLDPADQQRSIDGILKAIEAGGRFDALTPAEVAGRLAGRESVVLDEGLLAVPGGKLASGKAAYNQAAWEEAAQSLADAIDGYRDTFRGSNNADQLWEAWVYLGSCHLLEDPPNPEASKAAFAAAVALSPTRPLNPALFPPNVVEAYAAVQQELGAQKLAIQIVSSDATANVWLDGVDKGRTPAAVAEVIPGEHHVVARAPAGQGYARVDVQPAAGGPVAINVSLGAPSLGQAANSAVSRSNQISALYQSLGSRTEGIDYLLLVGVADSVLHVQLLNVTTDTWSKAIELPYVDDADDEAIQALPLLLNGISADGTFAAAAGAPAPLDIGANVELARLLTKQITPAVADTGGGGGNTSGGGGSGGGGDDPGGKKSKVGLVVGIVSGVVVASGVGVGIGLYGTGGPQTGTVPGENHGVVVVQF